MLNIPATTDNVHTLSFFHEATKGGIHAYDFLTSYDQAVAHAAAPPINITVELNHCGVEIGPPGDMGTTCESLRTGPYCVDVDVPDDPFISKDGSTQDRIDAYEAAWGNRTVRICANESITEASLTLCNHTVADGEDTGDSDINYVLSWTSTATEVVIEMAGHLSVSGDPTLNPLAWGVGLGSGSISGGPYHFKLRDLGGPLAVGPPTCEQTEISSLGQQDNQIKGADILLLPPDCEILDNTAEVCEGGDATFCVTASGGTPPYTYLWSTGQTTECITVSVADTYTVVVTDSNDLSSEPCSATLTVHPNPVCEITGGADEVCAGFTTEWCATEATEGLT
jgi:hypothetical protein